MPASVTAGVAPGVERGARTLGSTRPPFSPPARPPRSPTPPASSTPWRSTYSFLRRPLRSSPSTRPRRRRPYRSALTRPHPDGEAVRRDHAEVAPGTSVPGRPDTITLTPPSPRRAYPLRGVAPFRSAPPGESHRQGTRAGRLTVTVADGTGDSTSSTRARCPPTAGNTSWWQHCAAPMSATRCIWSRSRSGTSYPVQAVVAALTVTGPSLAGWQASATSPALQSVEADSATVGGSASPGSARWQATGDTATFTFYSSAGQASNSGTRPTRRPPPWRRSTLR